MSADRLRDGRDARGNWKPSKFALQAQAVYKEFFGARVTEHRKSGASGSDKPRLAGLRREHPESARAKLEAHSRCISSTVASMQQETFQDTPAASSSSRRLDEIVTAVSEVTAARSGVSSAASSPCPPNPPGSSSSSALVTPVETCKQDDKKDKKKAKKDKKEKRNKKDKKDKKHKKKHNKQKKEKTDKKNATDPASSHKKSLEEIEAEQDTVAAKKQKVAMATPLGEKVPHVDVRGGVFLQSADKLESCKKSTERAPPLGSKVKVLMANGALHSSSYLFFTATALTIGNPPSVFNEGLSWPEKPAARFQQTTDWWEAKLVVFPELAPGLETPEALVARMRGIRIADRQWLISNGLEGSSISFQAAAYMHFHVWLTSEFEAAWPRHSAVLSAFAERSSVKSKRGHLHVYKGSMPENPEFPRLSYEAVVQSAAALNPQQLTLQGLLTKLSAVHSD